ncbi:MAG: SCO family protein [Kangiellaceae bacterium]
MNKLLPYILIAIAAVAGLLLNQYLNPSEKQANSAVADQENGNRIDNRFETLLIYPKKNRLPAFQFVNQDNHSFTNENFLERWNLIFIGYTNCPDVCPNTLNQMTQLYNSLDVKTQQKFQFILLSVDPERDTPDHLKNYLDYFHEDFIGVSGDKTQLDKTVKALGGVYSLNKEEGEFYTVDHSARIFIVGPEARRYGIMESSSIASSDKSTLVKELTLLSM